MRTLKISGKLLNCTCNYKPNEKITTTKPKIIITANTGYQFLGDYTLTQEDEWGGLEETLTKNPKQNKLTYTIPDWVFTQEEYGVDLNSTYNATSTPKTITSFIHIYKVDDDILTSLSKVRFQNNIDYGNQILMLYVLPITLPTNIIGEPTNIILGNYDSKVLAPQIMNGEFVIDCGNILIDKVFNNAIDYLNNYRELTLLSPFFEPFVLNSSEFIGHECNVKYIINLYGGTLTQIITNNFTGKQNRRTAPIANSIPFIEKMTNSVINYLSSFNYSDGETMIVDKKQNYLMPETYSSYYGVSEHCYKQLNTIKGYAEIENIDLKTIATETQQNEIKKLLQNGVFFN